MDNKQFIRKLLRESILGSDVVVTIINNIEIPRHESEFVSQIDGLDMHTEWAMPQGMDEHYIWSCFKFMRDSKNSDKSLQEWAYITTEIKKSNPELSEISVGDSDEAKHLILGVASRFNIDDIRFFIERGRLGGPIFNDLPKKYRNMVDTVERKMIQKIGRGLNHVPSPNTLKYLQSRFSVK